MVTQYVGIQSDWGRRLPAGTEVAEVCDGNSGYGHYGRLVPNNAHSGKSRLVTSTLLKLKQVSKTLGDL